MNEYIAKAISPAIKIGSVVLVLAIVYLVIPEPMQKQIMTWLEWAWSKMPDLNSKGGK